MSRSGDTTNALKVHLTFGGTAVNGVDTNQFAHQGDDPRRFPPRWTCPCNRSTSSLRRSRSSRCNWCKKANYAFSADAALTKANVKLLP